MRRRPGLTLNVDDDGGDGHDALEDSYAVRDGNFVRGDLVVSSSGMSKRDSAGQRELSGEDVQTLRGIGRGVSSQVNLVRHRSGLLIALKVIHVFERSKRQQIMAEIATLYDARCPTLIDFYGAFYHEGTIRIGLQYMDQGCLASVLVAHGRLSERAVAGAMFQALWGLAYLKHEKRVHRDVKPQNILCNSRGEVKLTDFGISRHLENSIGMAQTFVGTFKYMSPERIQGHPYGYTSDVWSLGLVTLEMLTGRYPFPESSTQVDIMQTILESAPHILAQGGPGDVNLEPDLKEFLNFSLANHPKARLFPEQLLEAPWLMRHGACNVDSGRRLVREWLASLGVPALDDHGNVLGTERASAGSDSWASPFSYDSKMDD